MLVVWADDPNHILDRAQNVEDQLMNMIWKEQAEEIDEKTASTGKAASQAPSISVRDFANPDVEESIQVAPRRPVLIQAFATALTLVISVAVIGSGFRRVAVEFGTDGEYARWAFIAVAPIQLWLALVSSLQRCGTRNFSDSCSFSFNQSLVLLLNLLAP